jgi:hypothetical protein
MSTREPSPAYQRTKTKTESDQLWNATRLADGARSLIGSSR